MSEYVTVEQFNKAISRAMEYARIFYNEDYSIHHFVEDTLDEMKIDEKKEAIV